MTPKNKQRLDLFLKEQGLAPTRSKAQAIIMTGGVMVNGKVISKAGYLVGNNDDIILKDKGCPFVSRGGLKLEAALDHFKIEVTSRICMDVGASTGGFTDCLLQRGARLVYCIDVGYGQLDWSLRNRKDVINLERTNIRHLTRDMLSHVPDLATVDTSFISLKLVIPHVVEIVQDEADIICLIKPQFEAGRHLVGKGGIVKDEGVHKEVIRQLTDFFQGNLGLEVCGTIPSPILGAKGNKEFLVHLRKRL